MDFRLNALDYGLRIMELQAIALLYSLSTNLVTVDMDTPNLITIPLTSYTKWMWRHTSTTPLLFFLVQNHLIFRIWISVSTNIHFDFSLKNEIEIVIILLLPSLLPSLKNFYTHCIALGITFFLLIVYIALAISLLGKTCGKSFLRWSANFWK